MNYVKQHEVAINLKITDEAVLRLVADGKLTPYIYFEKEVMYGIALNPLQTRGIVFVTGLMSPSIKALREFLHRGINDEVFYTSCFFPSVSPAPKIIALDPEWFDTSSLHPPRFPVQVGISGEIVTSRKSISEMDRFEYAQSISRKKEGYPIRLGAFVYLASDVSQCKKKMKTATNKIKNFKDVTISLVPTIKIQWKLNEDNSRSYIPWVISGLQKKNGDLSKPGKILIDMAKHTFPTTNEKKSVSDLRRCIRKWMDTEEDPFYIDKQDSTYRPKFTLIIKKDDAREKDKATHVPYVDDFNPNFEKENDSAGEWLKENDK